MKLKSATNKLERSVNFKFILLIMLFGLIIPGLMVTPAAAFKIITKEDIIEKIVQQEDFIKTADNFIAAIRQNWQTSSKTSFSQLINEPKEKTPKSTADLEASSFIPVEVCF